MYDFSFCKPSSERAAKNGTLRGSVFPQDPFIENFFNKLCWEMTLFEFSSPKDIPQNSVQHNGSLFEEVWKHEGMGGIYEQGHEILHVVKESHKHTVSADASFTYHTVSLTETQRSQIHCTRGHLRSAAGAGTFYKTRQLILPGLSAASVLAKA